MHMKRHCLPCVLLAWIVSAGNVYADNGYTFRDLGNFGKQYARVVSINDQGVMLIYADERRSLRSFLVDGSRVTPLPEGFGGAAINNRGEVAGFSLTPVQAEEYNALPGAAVYSNGRVTSLAPVFSQAVAINDKGDIVGWTWPRAAVIWENRVLRVLDEATAGGFAYLTGINPKGLVVGYKEYPSNVYLYGWPLYVWRAVYWDQNGLHHLSPPSAAGLVGEEHQYAGAVNKKGDILVTTAGDYAQCVPPRIFILKDGAYLQVPLPPSGGFAHAINDSGEVAGQVSRGDVPRCGWMQVPGGAFVGNEKSYTLLPTPPEVRSSEAIAINKHGMVGGRVFLSNGETHAAVWEKR
jgi:uncharacterized membrane protein